MYLRVRLTCYRAVADAKTHIKSFIKHQVSAPLDCVRFDRVRLQAMNLFCFQEEANDAKASAYAARWYQQTVTKAKERYEEVSSNRTLILMLLYTQLHILLFHCRMKSVQPPPPPLLNLRAKSTCN